MSRIEKGALACLILYSAFYADAEWWTKEVCLACMFVFTLILFFAGGGKHD